MSLGHLTIISLKVMQLRWIRKKKNLAPCKVSTKRVLPVIR